MRNQPSPEYLRVPEGAVWIETRYSRGLEIDIKTHREARQLE